MTEQRTIVLRLTATEALQLRELLGELHQDAPLDAVYRMLCAMVVDPYPEGHWDCDTLQWTKDVP